MHIRIMKACLTVFFEGPFWIGVFERIDDGKLSVCKVTFGAEPKDYDVLEFVLRHYNELAFLCNRPSGKGSGFFHKRTVYREYEIVTGLPSKSLKNAGPSHPARLGKKDRSFSRRYPACSDQEKEDEGTQ